MKENKFVLHHHIAKEKEGLYYTIPFEVGTDIEKIAIHYAYPRSGPGKRANVVDLGIENSEGQFLGWSGSAHPRIEVGRYDSSPGYLSGPIESGKWSIIVGAYKIPDEGLDVVYTITQRIQEARWLVGDLHMHSTASDGQHTLFELIGKAQKEGLDFIAVSDHNNYANNLMLPAISGLTLIPAVEWTHYRGHMNFYGLVQPFANSFIANTSEEKNAVLAYVRHHHGLVSVNHPKCGMCPYLWDDEDFDLMEIWNGPMTARNRRAITWWTKLLSEGKVVPAVGGSDYHRDQRPVRFAHPVNIVYAKSPSVPDILDAIASGHLYISSSVHGVRMTLDCQGSTFGDTLVCPSKQRIELTLALTRLKPYHRLIAVSEQGEEEIPLERQGDHALVHLSRPYQTFVYFKVVASLFSKTMIAAVSNPLYFSEGND